MPSMADEARVCGCIHPTPIRGRNSDTDEADGQHASSSNSGGHGHDRYPLPLGVVLKTIELLTDIREVREQVLCLQCELRKIRCLKDLSNFQRARTPKAVPNP